MSDSWMDRLGIDWLMGWGRNLADSCNIDWVNLNYKSHTDWMYTVYTCQNSVHTPMDTPDMAQYMLKQPYTNWLDHCNCSRRCMKCIWSGSQQSRWHKEQHSWGYKIGLRWGRSRWCMICSQSLCSCYSWVSIECRCFLIRINQSRRISMLQVALRRKSCMK